MDKDGIANKIFEQFSITNDDIREEIERLIGYGTMENLELQIISHTHQKQSKYYR